MSSSRNPLGRGLGNLLAEAEGATPVIQDDPNYRELPLQEIVPNPNQPRKHFKQKELVEMAETLQSVGLIEPIIVRQMEGKKYQLIAGERRLRAAQIAGFKKIPAILKQATELQALEIGIIENIQREELNPVEEGRAYEYWMQTTKQKVDVLAKKVGKDRTTVKNLTRILKLPQEVLELIEKGNLSVGQARPLLGIGDARKLKQLAVKIYRESWTARRVEDEVARITESEEAAAINRTHDSNISKLEKELRIHLSAKVDIQHKRNGSGKVIVHYGNLKDLERLLESLGVQ